MSFVNAIATVALLLVSCIAGITGTVSSDILVEQATYSLADIAHANKNYSDSDSDKRLFDLTINSSNPEWYQEGMQLFTYELNGHYWIKRRITWTVLSYDRGRFALPREDTHRIIAGAFQKWAAAAASPEPFTFQQVPGRQADIQFTFEFLPPRTPTAVISLPGRKGALDHHVPILIRFDSDKCWTTVEGLYNYNLRYAALYIIGQALGLDWVLGYNSILNYSHASCRETREPVLQPDDIRGIQALYRNPSPAGAEAAIAAYNREIAQIPSEWSGYPSDFARHMRNRYRRGLN